MVFALDALAFNYTHFRQLDHLRDDAGEPELIFEGEFSQSSYPLLATFQLSPGGDRLALHLDGTRTHLSTGALERIADRYLDALKHLAVAPEDPWYAAFVRVVAEPSDAQASDAYV